MITRDLLDKFNKCWSGVNMAQCNKKCRLISVNTE